MPPSDRGFSRKQQQLHVPVDRLELDALNPRLPESPRVLNEAELLKLLHDEFYLDELAESMANNGYFDEEPLVAYPKSLPASLTEGRGSEKEFRKYLERDSTRLVVVEGNRRLATVKILLSSTQQSKLRITRWPKLTNPVTEDLSILPVIVYRKRDEVVPYLGVRHIVGIQKWDSYAKARYIAGLYDSNQSIAAIESQIGDKQGAVRKSLAAFRMLKQLEEECEFNTVPARKNFSLLLLSIGQRPIKRFLGLPSGIASLDLDSPVPDDRIENLRRFVTWILGDGRLAPVIRESRDITQFLSHVVGSEEALQHLELTGNLQEAFDRTNGEEQMLLKYLAQASRKLESALGVAHRHKTPEVKAEVRKCLVTCRELTQALKGDKDDDGDH